MGFVGTYSNVEAMDRVRRLLPKLVKLAAAGGSAPLPRTMPKRERAPVLSAVVQILTEAEAPMQARDIHAAVEASHGEVVSWSSVKDCLASNAGPRRGWRNGWRNA
jgi:thioester reductase-like protein